MDFVSTLHVASYRGHKGIVELLLDKRANVDILSRNFASAFLAASVEGYVNTVNFLLDNGASADMVGSVLRAASRARHADGLRCLLESNVTIPEECGIYFNRIEAAYYGRDFNTIGLSLDARVNVNANGILGPIPLH